MIEIDKNVLIPSRCKEKYPFRKMEVGDSFFVETENDRDVKSRLISQLFNHAKRINIDGLKITTRKEKHGIRCWRIQ